MLLLLRRTLVIKRIVPFSLLKIAILQKILVIILGVVIVTLRILLASCL